MISVKRNEDGSYYVLDGNMRLRAQIALHGSAEVIDLDSGKTVHIHELDGEFVALSEEAQAKVEDLALAAINLARM